MIEACIFEVYKRDRRVFIPEFGALIYSEFNDDIDFNSHLTFDDGKIVAEIMERQGTSDDEARIALNAYVQQLKDSIGQGKLHYIKGIGYFCMDQDGNYMVQKNNPDEDTNDAFTSGATTEEASLDPFDKLIDFDNEPIGKTDQNIEAGISPKSDELDAGEDDPMLDFDGNLIKKDDSIADYNDDNFQEDYREDTFSVNIDPAYQPDKKSGPNKAIISIAAVVVLILIAVSVYFFGFRNISEEVAAKPMPKSIAEALAVNNKDIKEDIDEADEAALDREEIIDATEEKTTETPEVSEPVNSLTDAASIEDESKTFCLIFGSFEEEKNADRYLKRIQPGVTGAKKISGRKGLYYIAIDNLKGKTSATQLLDQMQNDFPQAWIYNQAML